MSKNDTKTSERSTQWCMITVQTGKTASMGVTANWWFVWEVGSDGDPVRLTVRSITVAHKLHQD